MVGKGQSQPVQVRKGLAPWPVQGQVSKFAMCLHKQQPLSIVASPSTDKNCPVVLAIDQFRDAQISACVSLIQLSGDLQVQPQMLTKKPVEEAHHL